MTHTLHRLGSPGTLKRDYIIMAIASQTVDAGDRARKFRQFADIVLKYDPLNFGDMRTGNLFQHDVESIHDGYDTHSIVHAVFADAETVERVLSDLKEADLGLSIVLSGLFEKTTSCCRKTGLKPHTAQYALGVFGRTDLLPPPWVLELSTMCGHGMVSFSLIQHLARRIQNRDISIGEASVELARQCHCGVFNPDRAAGILKRAIECEKGGPVPDGSGVCNGHDTQRDTP